MAETLDKRIEQRNFIAEQNRQKQSLWQEFKGRIGLGAANAVDRADNVVNGDTTIFMVGSAYGGMRGAIFGTLGYMGIAALGLVSASAALPVLSVMVVAATIGMGIYQGQKDLETNRSQRLGVHLADHIAEKSGAIPEHSTAHSMPSLDPDIPNPDRGSWAENVSFSRGLFPSNHRHR